MLKEKIFLEFENMKEAIETLEDEHKKHSSSYERELVSETLKNIIKKIERSYGANQSLLENEETWDYGNEEYFVIEKYEKQTSAGVSMYDEFFSVHVEMNTEEIELELQLRYKIKTRNLIDAPFSHVTYGILSLNYNFK
mgnify:FL=1